MLLDYGMFMENLMLAARARGLDTYPQAAFADFPETIATTLGLPENERVICGMSLGYADPAAPENTLHTERAAVETFADFGVFSPEGRKSRPIKWAGLSPMLPSELLALT